MRSTIERGSRQGRREPTKAENNVDERPCSPSSQQDYCGTHQEGQEEKEKSSAFTRDSGQRAKCHTTSFATEANSFSPQSMLSIGDLPGNPPTATTNKKRRRKRKKEK